MEEEIDEIINEVLKNLRGKNSEQRVSIIESQLGVTLADVEASYSFDMIKKIIKSRIKEPCPTCGSEIKNEQCPDCGGKGYVSAVEAEKISLKKLKQGGD